MPVAPDVTVRKLALLTAVHVQVEAAVTAIEPEVAAPLTLMAALASVTVQEDVVDEGDGDVLLDEQAAAARATAADTAEASNRR